MRKVFADTFYWVALVNAKDNWHARALALSQTLRNAQIVTTEEVLVEVLTYLGSSDPQLRAKAVALTRRIFVNPQIDVIPQTHETFLAGLALYEARPDKTYSLTDCISMQAMRQAGLTEVLTHDEHFVQEGFSALFRK